MENEHEIAPEELAEPETEAAREETPIPLPKAEPAEVAEEAPQPESDPPAVAEAESEVRCPIVMGYSGPICGRKLHVAPAGADEQPVCLMHSKDPNKQSGPLFDNFWLEFERTLEESGEGEAHFERFVFPRVNFNRRTINAICRFYRAIFMQDAYFIGTVFTQDAYFHRVTFMRDASFFEATFTKDVSFIGATFTQNVLYSSVSFTQNANFNEVAFMQNGNFIGAIFSGNANFSGTAFMQDADFIAASFIQDVRFVNTTFTQNANFERTIFNGNADWRWSRFLDQAEFRHTQFTPKEPGTPSAVFSLAKFAKPGEVVFDAVNLNRALFVNNDVSAVWFTSSVQWAKRKGHRGLAVFEEEILLKPEFSDIQRRFGEIDHGAVEQIYHQLQKNYDSRLDYRKANDFHYGEMEMRRLEPPSDGRLLSLRRRIPRWLNLLTLYRLASDYGNSYAKPGVWLLTVLFAAMLTYPCTGLEKLSKPGCIVTYASTWNQQDTLANKRWSEAKLLVDSLNTTLDIATLQRNPEYVPAHRTGRFLRAAETILTSSLFALFLLAIRRQFRR